MKTGFHGRIWRAALILIAISLLPILVYALDDRPKGIQRDPWGPLSQFLGVVPPDDVDRSQYSSSMFGPNPNLPDAEYTGSAPREVPLEVTKPRPALPRSLWDQPMSDVAPSLPIPKAGEIKDSEFKLRFPWQDPQDWSKKRPVEDSGWLPYQVPRNIPDEPTTAPGGVKQDYETWQYQSSYYGPAPILKPAEQYTEGLKLQSLRQFTPAQAKSALPQELQLHAAPVLPGHQAGRPLPPAAGQPEGDLPHPFHWKQPKVQEGPTNNAGGEPMIGAPIALSASSRIEGSGAERRLTVKVSNGTDRLCPYAKMQIKQGDKVREETFIVGKKSTVEFRYFDFATQSSRPSVSVQCDLRRP